MLDTLFRGLVVVPFFGVPIALIAWTFLQLAVGALLRALVGLAVGGALCFAAFMLFLANIYCENCADRPVSSQEAVAIVLYFIFGVVMLVVLGWTAARSLRKARQDRA